MVLGLIISTWLKHLLELRGKKKTVEAGEEAVGFFHRSPLIFWGLVGAWLTLLISFFLMSCFLSSFFTFLLSSSIVFFSSGFFSSCVPILVSVLTKSLDVSSIFLVSIIFFSLLFQ